jgi:hypothetical protein
LCDVVAKLPQPAPATDESSARRHGHATAAKFTRDGIAAPKTSRALAFKKRRRVGPLR